MSAAHLASVFLLIAALVFFAIAAIGGPSTVLNVNTIPAGLFCLTAAALASRFL